MTIDEAIKHAEEVAEEKFNNAVSIMDKMKSDIALSNAEECKRCAEDYRQLAEWLKDYKRLKEQEQVLDKIRAEIAEYGSIWVEYKITGKRDKDIEQLVSDVLSQAKKQVLEIIDKHRGESEE